MSTNGNPQRLPRPLLSRPASVLVGLAGTVPSPASALLDSTWTPVVGIVIGNVVGQPTFRGRGHWPRGILLVFAVGNLLLGAALLKGYCVAVGTNPACGRNPFLLSSTAGFFYYALYWLALVAGDSAAALGRGFRSRT